MIHPRLPVPAFFFAALALAVHGCSGSGGGSDSQGSSPPEFDAAEAVDAKIDIMPGSDVYTRRDTRALTVPAEDGHSLRLELNLGSASAFQVFAVRGGREIASASLSAPDSQVVLSADRAGDVLQSMALRSLSLPEGAINILSYPSAPSNPPVQTGSYLHELVGNGASDYSIIVAAKNDPDLGQGTLRANIFYVGEFAQRADIHRAIRDALDRFRAIYRQAGISLLFHEQDVASDTGTLVDPSAGSEMYSAAASLPGVSIFAVNIFIGSTVDVPSVGADAFGKAPFIPGPAVQSPHSAVAIGLDEHDADGNDRLSAEEAVQLAYTIAHETGHYLGLFHPVEISGGPPGDLSFSNGDALGDTPSCQTSEECDLSRADENLMFPTAVEEVAQDNLTGEQAQVLNSQVVID